MSHPSFASNRLLNPNFQFSSFNDTRTGKATGFRSGSIPFWDQDAYGDAEVYRSPGNPVAPPRLPVDGVVILQPGKSLRQFRLLSEAEIEPGDNVTLSVRGHQSKPSALRASVNAMFLDHQPGEWKPSEFGQKDERSFPRQARGEMTPKEIAAKDTGEAGDFELTIPDIKIPGGAPQNDCAGVEVVFKNISDAPISLYAPALEKSGGSAMEMPSLYRHIPRTISKLRRGEPLHVVVMGSSIDRGSANPPLYFYDENPESPTFKQPASPGTTFDGAKVGHPDWTPYFGWWQHYFGYAGRLKRALMRRFDYPADELLFNIMACDGSSIGESHSALAEWTELRLPPDEGNNGHRAGKSWEELYPKLMARPSGPHPDLVIFGSGANEKIDGREEIAAFEGAIRWFQRHYPDVEFVFCMWQNDQAYTPNAGMLKDLSLVYGIPFVDFGRTLRLATRHVPVELLTPKDGHPQAAAHDLWARSLESVFQPADPIGAGFPQRFLPSRISDFTIGWEGEMKTYEAASPRIRKGVAFLLDDTVVNLWANGAGEKVKVLINGRDSTSPELENGSRLRPFAKRDPRNSTFVMGRLPLGERHLLEVTDGATIVAVDAKTALNRVFHGVAQGGWVLPRASEPFHSEWGAPYGSQKVTLRAGESATLEWTGTDCSIAWVSQEGGGVLIAKIDGVEKKRTPTGEATVLASGETLHMENRFGIRHLPHGKHRLEITAEGSAVDLLGAFAYDTRSNAPTQNTP